MSKVANVSVERTGSGQGKVTVTSSEGRVRTERFSPGVFGTSEGYATKEASRKALK